MNYSRLSMIASSLPRAKPCQSCNKPIRVTLGEHRAGDFYEEIMKKYNLCRDCGGDKALNFFAKMQGLSSNTTTDYDDNGDYDELLNLFENCKNPLKPHEKEPKNHKS
ncbi:MAG: hypothetical protein ACJ71J_09065 [Nitrososphaeraceae archaeon]